MLLSREERDYEAFLPGAVVLFLSAVLSAAVEWRPVEPSELAQKTAKVEPGADAEAIFWDVRLEDRFEGGDLSLLLSHYIRIKIFTDLGLKSYATVEIPQFGKRSISDIAGRTIKADGSIIELKKDAIFERRLINGKNAKLKGRTFTLPNVEPGDIIEYRFKEVRNDEIASHMRLDFQRELPLWSVTYHLKPLSLPWLPYAMRAMAFQCNHPPFQREPGGFYSTSMANVPAFREEPHMPPADTLRAWLLIYYEEDNKVDAEKYWKEIGKSDYEHFKSRLNPDSQVKRTAAELVSGADDPKQKLAALDRFCRTKIGNLNSGTFQLNAAERKALKENRSPGDTLKQKAGTSTDIKLLFAALANASGFEARMARVADRGDFFFTKDRQLTYFLSTFDVAVRVDDRWVFFDPATPYLEPGMLRWQEEGSQALISDPKEGFFVSTPFLDVSRSACIRRGRFKLGEDGSLEGSVQYTYTGHQARAQKAHFENLIPAQQEEDWKNSTTERLSKAEISGFEVRNARDFEKPLVVKHTITVPEYATRTGKRILLQPSFFQRNRPQRFAESNRKWDLYFDYGWIEDDEVTIDLPDGWELDQPLLPVSTNFGEVGAYSVKVLKTTDGRKLIYRRTFDWGRENLLLIPKKSYPNVKVAFDFVQEQDAYTIALKAVSNAR